MKKIDYFGEFIEENKGLLAAIGIFAALTKYFFFTSPTDDFTKLILNDNFLPALTFLLFIFLSGTLAIKIQSDKRSKNNNYMFIFGLLFFFFTLSIIGYFITFFGSWVEWGVIIALFFVVLISLGNLYSKYLEKIKGFWFNLVYLLIGLVIIYLLNFIKLVITNEYILFGLIAPIYIAVIFLSIIPSALSILKIIKKLIFKN